MKLPPLSRVRRYFARKSFRHQNSIPEEISALENLSSAEASESVMDAVVSANQKSQELEFYLRYLAPEQNPEVNFMNAYEEGVREAREAFSQISAPKLSKPRIFRSDPDYFKLSPFERVAQTTSQILNDLEEIRSQRESEQPNLKIYRGENE